jgi:hypothetical protein
MINGLPWMKNGSEIPRMNLDESRSDRNEAGSNTRWENDSQILKSSEIEFGSIRMYQVSLQMSTGALVPFQAPTKLR